METIQVDQSASDSPSAEPGKTLAWQRTLLPFMASLLVALAIFAGVSNFYQARIVQRQLESARPVDLKPAFDLMASGPALSPADRLASARFQALALLESHAVQSRYRQASIIMMCRVYIVFLSFTTGVVMAMVGAAFILGKIQEPASTLKAGSGSWRMALQSSSPGLFLAFFGSVLILTTILTRSEVSVNDGVLYMRGPAFEASAAAPAPTAAQPAAPPAKAASSEELRRSLLQGVRQAESEKAAKKQ